MSLEQALAANTVAIEALTAALTAATKPTLNTEVAAPAKVTTTTEKPTKAAAEKPAKPAADEAPKATRDEMVAALKALGEAKSAEAAKEVIKSVGKSEKMAQIKDALVDAVYKAAKAKLAEEEGEEEPGDEL